MLQYLKTVFKVIQMFLALLSATDNIMMPVKNLEPMCFSHQEQVSTGMCLIIKRHNCGEVSENFQARHLSFISVTRQVIMVYSLVHFQMLLLTLLQENPISLAMT